MKLLKAIKASALLCTMASIVIAIVKLGESLELSKSLRNFTEDNWQKYPDKRCRMIDNLFIKYDLKNMVYDEIITLLGMPLMCRANIIGYLIGVNDSRPVLLCFNFENTDLPVSSIFIKEDEEVLYENTKT